MRKKPQNIRQVLEAPLTGFGIVLLSLGCLMMALWALIIIVRVVLG